MVVSLNNSTGVHEIIAYFHVEKLTSRTFKKKRILKKTQKRLIWVRLVTVLSEEGEGIPSLPQHMFLASYQTFLKEGCSFVYVEPNNAMKGLKNYCAV